MAHHEFTQIGKYQIEDLIGEGAMGVVYLALDPVLNRHVAVKVMGDALARDAELRDRFLREARAAGSLQHPNVITIYDFGEVENHLYIAMEYVEGIDLDDVLRSGSPLSLDAKLAIMIDVLNGLAYAHKRGVVHRDIKPANIRVNDEGHARIMDFGIARLESATATKMTRTGVMLGTPNYMAPEQIVGDEITPRTDIFAAGAVLYELLTNVRPFQADTLHAVLYKITSESPTPVDKLLPGLPPALNGIVMRALEKDPNRRFATALEMSNELARVRGALAPGSNAPSLHATIEQARLSGSTLRAQARERRRTWIAAGSIAAAAVLALVWLSLSSSAPRNDASLTSPPIAPQGSPSLATADTGSRVADSVRSARDTADGTIAAGPAQAVTQPRVVAAERAPGGARRAPDPAAVADSMRRLAAAVRERSQISRVRALEAGATTAQLDGGDLHQRQGDAALRQGQFTRAADHFSRAAAAWLGAEREARATLAAAPPPVTAREVARGQTTAVQNPPPPVSSPAPNSTPVQSATVPAPAPTVATPPPNDRAEIAAVIASYARAIEARDVGAIRRVYPGLTREQQRGFEQFFASVRSLRAEFAVEGLQVEGANAEARLQGSYEYVTSQGRGERQAVTFQAALRREGGAWRLTSVR